ncbi:hypothetical protein D3C76_1482750 [compost metagenome]
MSRYVEKARDYIGQFTCSFPQQTFEFASAQEIHDFLKSRSQFEPAALHSLPGAVVMNVRGSLLGVAHLEGNNAQRVCPALMQAPRRPEAAGDVLCGHKPPTVLIDRVQVEELFGGRVVGLRVRNRTVSATS